MKKLLLPFLSIFGIISLGFSKGPTVTATCKPATANILISGATTLTEISNALLLALQTNNTDPLSTYFLTEAELKTLRQIGSEDMQAVLENNSAEELKNSFAADLQQVIQEGVTKTVNWTELLVSDTKAGKATRKNRMLLPVEAMLQTKQNQPVALLYEVVKIKNRYYLFRGVRLKA